LFSQCEDNSNFTANNRNQRTLTSPTRRNMQFIPIDVLKVGAWISNSDRQEGGCEGGWRVVCIMQLCPGAEHVRTHDVQRPTIIYICSIPCRIQQSECRRAVSWQRFQICPAPHWTLKACLKGFFAAFNIISTLIKYVLFFDPLCGLVIRVPGYRS
jgi:hypothetical protein